MSDLLHRVATAICVADCGVVTPNELARCEGLARAAIEALMVPALVETVSSVNILDAQRYENSRKFLNEFLSAIIAPE